MFYCDEYEVEESVIDKADYDHALDHLQGIIEDVYKTGSIENLEFHLEEVLHVFGLKIPEGKPLLMKKPTPEENRTDRMLKAWVGYTRAYAEMMTK